MKATEAPERIWINPATDLVKLNGYIDKDSVKYVRTDSLFNPSRKQLEALKRAFCCGSIDFDDMMTLANLYEQLKVLYRLKKK